MRAIKIKTECSPEPFSVAQISSYLVLPSLPNGTSEVLDGTSHPTQRREARPSPTGLLRIPVEANFLGRAKKVPRGSSRGIDQQPENPFLFIRSFGEMSSKLPKATPDDEEGGIGTAGTIQEA